MLVTLPTCGAILRLSPLFLNANLAVLMISFPESYTQVMRWLAGVGGLSRPSFMNSDRYLRFLRLAGLVYLVALIALSLVFFGPELRTIVR